MLVDELFLIAVLSGKKYIGGENRFQYYKGVLLLRRGENIC